VVTSATSETATVAVGGWLLGRACRDPPAL